jgi:hypothetical protein
MEISNSSRRLFRVPAQCLLSLGLALIIGDVAPAQTSQDFFALQKAVALLIESPIGQSDRGRDSVSGVRDQVDAFQKYLEEDDANSQAAAAVQHLVAVVTSAANTGDLSEAAAIVDDIKKDIELKTVYYGGRAGVTGNARGLVKVTVNTLRNGQHEKGLVVYCNPYRWADDLKPMEPFPNLSSPTQWSMLPGDYRCFASKGQPAKPIGFRDVKIGLHGDPTVSVDVPLTNE